MKKALRDEIDGNFARYRSKWPKQKETAFTALQSTEAAYKRSYRRLTSLQAWRSGVLDKSHSAETLSFFLEAQNDGLYSHCLAQMGAWRLALQALRCCLENICLFLYYKDHPVELALWKTGDHRLAFREIKQYFGKHPALHGTPKGINGVDQLSNQFDVLSKAVHGAAVDVKMTTKGAFPNLWYVDSKRLQDWENNERRTIETANLLLVALFKNSVIGTKNPGLRDIVGNTLSVSKRAAVKTYFKVNVG